MTNLKKSGFTIVELLVVIVVIGILAAITIVSYTGITQKAIAATLRSDLKNASTQLEIDKTLNETYPATVGAANGGSGLAKSNNTVYQYTSTGTAYCLTAVSGMTAYYISSDNSVPTEGVCTGHTAPGGGEAVVAASTFVVAWGGPPKLTLSDPVTHSYGRSLIQTSDGGYAVTGWTDIRTPGDNNDMFITKYDSASNLSWNRTWGGAGEDYGYSIVQASDGGFAVTGLTESYGIGGSRDMFIAKYELDGDLSWSKTWGDARTDIGRSIVQTSDGGYVVTGGTDSFGDQKIFVVKYDSSGEVSWDKTWGGSGGYENGMAIIQTADSGYAVTGSTYFGGVNNMVIIKFDSSGDVLWNKTWGGTGDDEGKAIIQTSDNGYIVTGYTNSPGSLGAEDMFIVKYDSTGTQLWDRLWGGTNIDYGESIVETSDGGFAVAGTSSSFMDDVVMFIAKYDEVSNLSWSKAFSFPSAAQPSSTEGFSIAQTSDSGFVMTGQGDNLYGFGGNLYGNGPHMILAKFNSMGDIYGCPNTACQSINASQASPTASVSSPTASVDSPTVTTSTPTANTSAIVNPWSPPVMTLTFSSQELFIVWPGGKQTVCKQWTVPVGNTIKGFLVSQETEADYDFFTVSVDEVEKYNKSGYLTDQFVDISATPGTIISACMSTDEYTQDGYGGEVIGVLYN